MFLQECRVKGGGLYFDSITYFVIKVYEEKEGLRSPDGFRPQPEFEGVECRFGVSGWSKVFRFGSSPTFQGSMPHNDVQKDKDKIYLFYKYEMGCSPPPSTSYSPLLIFSEFSWLEGFLQQLLFLQLRIKWISWSHSILNTAIIFDPGSVAALNPEKIEYTGM